MYITKFNSFLLHNLYLVEWESYWTKAEGDISSHVVVNASRGRKLGGFHDESHEKYIRKCCGLNRAAVSRGRLCSVLSFQIDLI
jgi:hypothetical protein